MDEMARVLREEEAELARQQRMVEIDRLEAQLYPEEDDTRGELSTGDDRFTKEMKEQGLKHTRKSGSEIRITADMLPPELDMFTAFADAPPMEDDDEDEESTLVTTRDESATSKSDAQHVAAGKGSDPTDSRKAKNQDAASDAGRAGREAVLAHSLVMAITAPPEPQQRMRRRNSAVDVSIDGAGPRAAKSEPDIAALLVDLDFEADSKTSPGKGAGAPAKKWLDPFGGQNMTRSMRDLRDISFAL